MKKWEYKVFLSQIADPKELNRGWELVSHSSFKRNTLLEFVFYFKREQLCSISSPISSSEILNSHTSPVELIPAPESK